MKIEDEDYADYRFMFVTVNASFVLLQSHQSNQVQRTYYVGYHYSSINYWIMSLHTQSECIKITFIWLLHNSIQIQVIRARWHCLTLSNSKYDRSSSFHYILGGTQFASYMYWSVLLVRKYERLVHTFVPGLTNTYMIQIVYHRVSDRFHNFTNLFNIPKT